MSAVVPSGSVRCSYTSEPSGAWWRNETACSYSPVVSGSSCDTVTCTGRSSKAVRSHAMPAWDWNRPNASQWTGEPFRSVGSGECGAAAGRPGCQVVFTGATDPGGWTVLTTLSGVPCCRR